VQKQGDARCHRAASLTSSPGRQSRPPTQSGPCRRPPGRYTCRSRTRLLPVARSSASLRRRAPSSGQGCGRCCARTPFCPPAATGADVGQHEAGPESWGQIAAPRTHTAAGRAPGHEGTAARRHGGIPGGTGGCGTAHLRAEVAQLDRAVLLQRALHVPLSLDEPQGLALGVADDRAERAVDLLLVHVRRLGRLEHVRLERGGLGLLVAELDGDLGARQRSLDFGISASARGGQPAVRVEGWPATDSSAATLTRR
jgi:hypothetical protein